MGIETGSLVWCSASSDEALCQKVGACRIHGPSLARDLRNMNCEATQHPDPQLFSTYLLRGGCLEIRPCNLLQKPGSMCWMNNTL